MNVLGVGSWEFIAILIIMLIVAGPERMIKWARIWGRYVAWAWSVWTDMMESLQAELDEAGVDVQLPKQPPTRQSLARLASDITKPVVQPVQEVFDEVNTEMEQLKSEATVDLDTNGHGVKQETTDRPPTEDQTDSGFGTWSGQSEN